MLYGNGSTPGEDAIDTLTLLGIAVGLAMDAFAVAIATGIVIGVVACTFTAAGLHLGKRRGTVFGKRMEVVGGLVLVGIGVKILFDHFRG